MFMDKNKSEAYIGLVLFETQHGIVVKPPWNNTASRKSSVTCNRLKCSYIFNIA
jgi:hypothetical protein